MEDFCWTPDVKHTERGFDLSTGLFFFVLGYSLSYAELNTAEQSYFESLSCL